MSLLWFLVLVSTAAVGLVLVYENAHSAGERARDKEIARIVDLYQSYHFDVGEKRYCAIPEAYWQLHEWGYTIQTEDGTVRDRVRRVVGEHQS